EIHQLVALQVYEFCRSRNLVFVWVYLYSNWYTRDQWTLWARSARNAIPAGKTTMMIEAHWRVLKRVHLHHINRPRLDYLVYIIISRQCGRLIRSFNQKIATRQVLPEWEGQFRNEWKDLMSRPVQNNRYALYQTDPASWVCGCPYFIHSRFLLCKHLVHRSRHLGNSQGHLTPRRYVITRNHSAPYVKLIPVRNTLKKKKLKRFFLFPA
ncbi:hypothetical protein DM01DRAFT_1279332, partial [Hesseltinella vesiculosa]